MYCPPGSWEPSPVSSGYYCIHTGPDAGALDLVDNSDLEEPEANKPLSLEFPLYGQRQLCSAEIPCEPGYYCVGGIKYACPPGTFGWNAGLATPQCSGPCAAGYYCPSTLKPEETPAAPQPPLYELNWPGKPHLHAAGLGFECGDVSLYCPAGSPYPRVVRDGYYTTGVDMERGGRVNTTRSGQRICPRGNYCLKGIAYNCPKSRYN